MRHIASLFFVVSAALAAAQSGPSLKIGSAAPPIQVAQWMKGDPVKEFKPGQVYVVEFWATWCGPCKVSIPHLTELQKKYGSKVVFTGVSVWEQEPGKTDTAYLKTVADFVKEQGDGMGYTVAADGPEGTMARTWMEASGQDGIPAAFIVDGSGKVAWIGHPMGDLDEVLGQVLAGTYDSAAAAKAAEEEAAKQAEMAALMTPIQQALEAGDFKRAIDLMDKAMAEKPDTVAMLGMTKFSILLQMDPKKGVAYAQELADGPMAKDSMALNQIAWTMVDPEEEHEGLDWAVAARIAEKASKLENDQDANIMDTWALATFKTGDAKKAYELQKKAVELAKKDPEYPADSLKDLEARLEQFKKAAGG